MIVRTNQQVIADWNAAESESQWRSLSALVSLARTDLVAVLEVAEYDLANGGHDHKNTLATIRAALVAAKEVA